jgi:glycoside/pentoside/hexuronide:cation symporter, GPH family
MSKSGRIVLSAAETLPQRAVVGYALGSLATGVYSTVPTVLLLFYCTEILRIAPATAAAILFLPKAWAMVWDPIVGTASDRSQSRHGRRAPYILGGAIGVTISFALLFNAPKLSSGATVAYVGIAYFLLASAYSVFAVPYVAVPAEISSLPAERERLTSWRMTLAMAGVLIGAALAPMLASWAGGGRRGYGVMAVVIALTCGAATLVAWWTVRTYHARDHATTDGEPLRLYSGLKLLAGNRYYLKLWLEYLLGVTGSALFLAMVPYFVTRVLGGSENDAGVALLCLLAGTLVAMPGWGVLMRRLGGDRAFSAAVAGFTACAALFVLVPTDARLTPLLPLYFVLGLSFAGLQLVPFALLAHVTHDGASGSARLEGLYTGVWTAGEKLGLALGPAVAGLGLSAIGYVAGTSAQTAQTAEHLRAIIAIGPALFLLPCLAMQLRSSTHASVRPA